MTSILGQVSLAHFTAPLFLLFEQTSGEVASRLRDLFDHDQELTLNGGQITDGSSFGVLFQGVSLKIRVTEHVGDLAGFKNIFCNIDATSVRSAVSLGLGDHVRGGEKIPAIVRMLLGAARMIAEPSGCVAVAWHPARTISGFDYFAGVVADYQDGGAFPVLALVNFRGEGDAVTSQGLDWLSGQELTVAVPDLPADELMRRVVRVVHDIAVNGPVTAETIITGMEPGERFTLAPVAGDNRVLMKAAPPAV